MIEVSVLMAVYKEPLSQVKQAVESTLVALSRFEYQFIVVIDNPEVTPTILEYLSSKDASRFVLICNKENLGLACSLNLGIEHVTGKYVLRMDADDICHHDRVNKQFFYMELNPEVTLLGCSMIKIDEKGKRYGHTKSLDGEYSTLHKNSPIYYRTLCFHPTWMIRSNMLKEYKYYPLKTSQDLELQFRLLFDGMLIRNLDESLHFYRISSSALSLVGGWRQTLTRRALNRLYGRGKNKKATDQQVMNMISRLDNRVLRYLFNTFHGIYTKGLLKKNVIYVFISLLFSPIHLLRFYYLLKHKLLWRRASA